MPDTARRVLIAEDEALIRLDLKEMLEEEGYAVVGEANDGEEAVALALELRPDLVILDVKMPKMDGIAAAERIAGDRIAPVIILTAFSQRDLVERAREAGAMAYLVKPFQKKDLMPTVEMAASRFAEIVALEQEVSGLQERSGGTQDHRAGQGCADDRAQHVRAGGVPVDPADGDGPPDHDARDRRGGPRRRLRHHRRLVPLAARPSARSRCDQRDHWPAPAGPAGRSRCPKGAGGSCRGSAGPAGRRPLGPHWGLVGPFG